MVVGMVKLVRCNQGRHDVPPAAANQPHLSSLGLRRLLQ